jgi:hypothetical protein
MNLPAYQGSYKRRARRAHERFAMKRRRCLRRQSWPRIADRRHSVLLRFLLLVRARLQGVLSAHVLAARPT